MKLTPRELFLAFSRMALMGFGGVMPFAYRQIVEVNRWYTPAEFSEMLALGQTLPGPTICNVAIMVGWRHCGVAGSIASLAGIVAGPFFIVLVLGFLYQNFGTLSTVRAALAGMSAVAAGLIVATALKMGVALVGRGTASQRVIVIAWAALAFVGVGLLRWPLIAVVGVLGPLAVLAAFRRRQ